MATATPFYTSEEVFSIMKSYTFWEITPCSLLKFNRRFGGMFSLHLQGRKINQTRKQRESRWQAEHRGFLLGLFFYLEDGGDIFLRNID
jgi:hypothetical protein